MRREFRWITLCFAVALARIARADDTIDNPAYLDWAHYNPGTSVTYSTDSNTMGNTSAIATTTTLTDLTADKATVSVATSMLVNGKNVDLPPQSQDIPAKVKKPSASTGMQPADAPKTETGTQDVQAAGKTYSCTKTTVTTNQNAICNVTTTWTSDQVPGGIVKMESDTSGAMTSTTKMMLTGLASK